jgi:prepilin-type N-terminal cleavage/methylation domain-containing protein
MRRYFKMKRHGSRGMSLVELLVVLAILSVVMMAVMSLYIPAHQSTVAQTQVSDVQSNLRLALKTMTRDLLTAGFLMPYDPIAFPDATPNFTDDNLDDPGTKNSADFIIRTRAVGSDFARIKSVTTSGSSTTFTVMDPEMVANFPSGSRVRVFEPISATEFKEATGTPVSRAYPVTATGYNTITLTTGVLLPSDLTVLPESVIIRIKDQNQPVLQTIRYRLLNGTLRREVNDAVQVLARNVDTSDTSLGGTSFFDYNFTPEDRVNRVDIKLTGLTAAGGKSRAIETTVKLRNIN